MSTGTTPTSMGASCCRSSWLIWFFTCKAWGQQPLLWWPLPIPQRTATWIWGIGQSFRILGPRTLHVWDRRSPPLLPGELIHAFYLQRDHLGSLQACFTGLLPEFHGFLPHPSLVSQKLGEWLWLAPPCTAGARTCSSSRGAQAKLKVTSSSFYQGWRLPYLAAFSCVSLTTCLF
jgi:hypothetical protein